MNNNKEFKKLNKKKVYITIIIIILIIGGITSSILYSNNKQFMDFVDKYIFRKDVKENNLPYVEVDFSKQTNIFALKIFY